MRGVKQEVVDAQHTEELYLGDWSPVTEWTDPFWTLRNAPTLAHIIMGQLVLMHIEAIVDGSPQT